MSASIALLATIGLVAALFAHERNGRPPVSAASWLPVLWIAITGSRFVSQWLSVAGLQVGPGDMAEGSPIDALYFLVLILAGALVLHRRRLRLASLARSNAWLVAFFAFGLLSVLWSDFGFVAGKRWIKALGHPVMALIVVTDRDPEQALRVVLRRCAFLLLPFSVLLIKYFPQYGRGFDPFTGQGYNAGVALNKNDLGYVCMIFGLYFVWELAARRPGRPRRVGELAVNLAFLGLIAWLLRQADSATALVTFAIGAITIVATRVIDRRRVAGMLLLGFVLAGLAEWLFDVSEYAFALLGRDPTLTDRTQVWSDALALQDSPLLGAGFESFWLGERLQLLWAKWWWRPIQAHNGYVETYLNLGAVGLALLLGLIASSYLRIRRSLAAGSQLAPLQLAFLFAVIAYNFTEAGFKGVHLVWTLFTIMTVHIPRRRASRPVSSAPSLAAHSLRHGVRARRVVRPG